MTTWPPIENETEIQQWTPADLRDGDLVFGQRIGGPFAKLCAAADEPWMHVGSLTTDQNSDLVVVELRGHKLLLTDPGVFFSTERYQSWGAARLKLSRKCIDDANQWMRAKLQGERTGEQTFYPFDDYILAGVIAAGSRGLMAAHPDEVRAAIAAAAQAAKDMPVHVDGEMSLTCSAFMQVAYDRAGGPCVIEHPRWRSEPMSWPERSPFIDELFEMSDDELRGYDDVRLVDLYLEQERVDRGEMVGLLRTTTKQQWSEMLRVVLAAICGLAHGSAPAPGELGVDSRWVTPGDLWRSPTVLERAHVSVDHAMSD